MKKRFFTFIIAVLMLFTALPLQVFSATEQTVTITVVDADGTPLSDAKVEVTRVYSYWWQDITANMQVNNAGNGVYTFERSTSSTKHYSVKVSKEGYDTYGVNLDPDTDDLIVTLYASGEVWISVKLYYRADGSFPDDLTVYQDPALYGPSHDDTPFVTINVNATKLQNRKDVVQYVKSQNVDYYVPVDYDEWQGNQELTSDKKRELSKPFWDAVVDCMDAASKLAFENTGLFDIFVGYCLKDASSGTDFDYHLDGVLEEKPPVYLIELYDHADTYIGSIVDGADQVKENTEASISAELAAVYKNNYNGFQENTWKKNGKGYEFQYISGHYRYTVQVSPESVKRGSDVGNLENETHAGITYVPQTKQYYLASFVAERTKMEQIEFKVTYTDGLPVENVFPDQVYELDENQPVPSFDGSTDRAGFRFIGWVLQHGDGTVMSQEDISENYPTVKEDLTFVAVYNILYQGIVEVLLDGVYNSQTGTATGNPIDVQTATGYQNTLFVKSTEAGSNYIELTNQGDGKYSVGLDNGDYQIYYFDGTNYILSSEQMLVINNADRTRYLFFNSVTYKLDGGTDGPNPAMEYHDTGSAVTVSESVPTKEGYRFLGWTDQDGNMYQSGAQLTNAIGKAYILTAQWEKVVDVYVNITLDHGANTAQLRRNMVFTVDSRTGDSGTYTELIEKSIVWNDRFMPSPEWDYSHIEEANITTYKSNYPVLQDVPATDHYTFTTNKPDYKLESVTETRDIENGIIILDAVLIFDPALVEFTFDVELDDDAMEFLQIEGNEIYRPAAVNVKVTAWDGKDWVTIAQHKDTYLRVDLDDDGKGTGSFPVWKTYDGNTAYYRIEIVSYVHADGTIVAAKDIDDNHIWYNSLGNRYNGKIETTDCEDPDAENENALTGAWFVDKQQQGTVKAIISIPLYKVTFKPNGGELNGTEDDRVVENQIVVPDLNKYVPAREGGYLFDGWYLAENGAMTDEIVTSGYPLFSDITLIAKWREPLKIQGIVTTEASHTHVHEDGEEDTHILKDGERAETAVVLLQKILPNGYTETVAEKHVTFDYTREEYYRYGNPIGVANYAFTQIPNDGTAYRVQLLLPNYITKFQNEPDSLVEEKVKNYPSYNETDFNAEYNEDTIAVVNIHNDFSPDEFELSFEVDATRIGKTFRPDSADVLVTYNGESGNFVPSTWPVISMMQKGSELEPAVVTLEDGIGEKSVSALITFTNGQAYYRYGIRVDSTTIDGTETEYTAEKSYFIIQYQDPAYYRDGSQSQPLVATLIPKTYNIIYELDGGSMSGEYPTTHTWSYETSVKLDVPTRPGFRFEGWYTDNKFENEFTGTIDASVAEDVTLYAKWLQVMDVVNLTVIIKHNQEGDADGLAGNYNKDLKTQLLFAPRSDDENKEYSAMNGYVRNYPDGQWHTRGDEVQTDTLQVPRYFSRLSAEYDYNVMVELDGYYVSERTVTKVAQLDGSTLHEVVVTLQFSPELFMMEFYVKMAEDVPAEMYPETVDVKVTSWYDHPTEGFDWHWNIITQHESISVPVTIDQMSGVGHYEVWQWYNAENPENKVPYHYRIEVVRMNFADGSSIEMQETVEEVTYVGGAYNANIVVDNGAIPEIPFEENENEYDGGQERPTTDLYGVYGIECEVENGTVYKQQGTVGAIIDINRVTFHTNNEQSKDNDVFRTYYYNDVNITGDGNFYLLDQNGTVSSFYDIPEFIYHVHNDYIFKGWYLDQDSTDRPLEWGKTTFKGDAHVYAHWIKVQDVATEDADNKNQSGTYNGYDNLGAELRIPVEDNIEHYGDADYGLRFYAVLSESVYADINALSGENAEYGFVIAKYTTTQTYSGDQEGYTLQYNGENVNGVDTTESYKYVQNVMCSGVPDHYDGTNYRLYSAVITFTGLTGDALTEAQATEFVARAYIRYTDANGLYRTYYNNYDTNDYASCKASYSGISDGETQNTVEEYESVQNYTIG